MGLSDIETIPDSGAVFTIGRSRFADNVASHFFIRKDPVVSITCGDEHSAVICQSGRLFVFGSNDWGQLGLGHKNHVSKPSCVKILKPEKVTHVACGRAHTLICTGGQKIFACGSDQEGQLGRGPSAIGDSASTPVLVYDCGLAGPKVLEIAAGSHHSLALTNDGGVVAWGSNLEGQLGLPGISGLVNKPTKVHLPEPVKEITAGYYHSAFLTESGLVYVCGESESGKLGVDVSFSTQVAPKQMQLPCPAVRVVCGGHHTLILAENGNLYCAGSNASGQLGMGTNVTEIQTPKLHPRGALQNETVSQIACGESHSAVVTESGKLYTCGDGRHGKLGLEENENNVHELTFAPKYQELFISNVACGGCHTILVGRRRDTNNQTHREADSTQTDLIQKKNPLPPLKLPVNRLQSEQHAENTHEQKMVEPVPEKNDADAAAITTTPTKSVHENMMESTQQNSTGDSINHIENGIDKIESPRKVLEDTVTEVSSATEELTKPVPVDTDDKPKDDSEKAKSVADTENNVKEEEKTESAVVKEANTTNNVQNNSEESMEHVKNNNVEESDETKSESVKNETESTNNVEKEPTTPKKETSSSGSTPPPKPPRLKPGSGSNSPADGKSLPEHQNESPTATTNNVAASEENIVNNVKEPELTDDPNGSTTEVSQSPAKSSMKGRKSVSAKSRVDAQETTEISKCDKVDGVDAKENSLEEQKTENYNAPDDADVVQSPAPKTSKMSKLFKSKKQQEMENGTKTTGAANHKSKSKTCAIL